MVNMGNVTLQSVFKELQDVKKELRVMKYALTPVEKISARERLEFHRALGRMQKGKEKSFRDAFNE